MPGGTRRSSTWTAGRTGSRVSCACRRPGSLSRSCGRATISPRRSAGECSRRRRVPRTALVYALPALAILLAWLRIEDPKREILRAVLLAALALAPALAGGLKARLLVLAVTLVAGSWIAPGAEP